ncbi:polyubiquitin-like [Mobula birostris]|uniref:polyubiquitin-like n=1 Tax=Mobula birostris TaxID=1983395 RepID=UPI003B28C983
MRLQVRFITGDGFELDVDPSIQVSTLKMKIQEKTKVPILQQRLMVQNGQSVEMQDQRSLSYYNLSPSPTVMLLVRKEESMQIFLLNDKGKTSTYDVMPSESVQNFKARVHRQEGVRPDQQRLVYEGKQLEDGRLLSDYNIKPLTTISLLLRLRGG